MVGVLGEGRGSSLAQPIHARAFSVEGRQHGGCLDPESVFDQARVA